MGYNDRIDRFVESDFSYFCVKNIFNKQSKNQSNTSINNQSQINQKTINNQSQINQQSINNQSKNNQKSVTNQSKFRQHFTQ